MTDTRTDCPPLADRITKSLLGYGVIAGPVYVVVAAAQIAAREGYDPTRHAVSQLANGDYGWVQVVNFLVVGAMTVAGAVGIGRALAPGRHAVWAGTLLAGFGAGMLAAAALRADPSDGFPPGTPPGMGTVTWHGIGHLVAAGLSFLCFVAAALVIASAFARKGMRGWAWFSRITAVSYGATFAALASGTGGAAAMLAFTGAVVLGWAWLSAVSIRLYRTV